jgi:hypothetical protein
MINSHEIHSVEDNLSLDDTIKEIEHLIKSAVRSVPSENKFEFLDKMNKQLGQFIASNYERMNMDHEGASYPDWLYRQNIGKTEDEVEIIRSVRPDSAYISCLDHFGRPNIIPREIGDEDKWKWVSNPYFLSYEGLETMIEEMKKYGAKFDIVGESNYLPGRTFQIRFRKIKPNDK